MKTVILKSLIIAAVAVGALATPAYAAPISAGCTSESALGNLTPPDIQIFGNSFSSPQSFSDCYGFSLDTSADALGLTFEWDASWNMGIDLLSASLWNGSSSLSSVALPGSLLNGFQFSGLTGGNYWLVVNGTVSDLNGVSKNSGSVGYLGLIATQRATSVPEPGTLALLGLGLAAAGFARRRRAA